MLPIKLTQYLLCTVSMVLTALFALSFAPLAEQDGLFGWLHPVLMVLTGISIDLGKYVFWHARSQHLAFLLLSCMLVIFSWAASVAFFVTQERAGIERSREETAVYHAHNSRVETLRELVVEKRQLAQKRLESKYHEQWDKSEQLLREIATIERELTDLLLAADSVGLEAAVRSRSTSAFFSALSAMSGIPASIVYVVGYAVLAMMIEVCSLGLVSLSAVETKQRRDPVRQEKTGSGDVSRETLLRRDILNGNVAPVTRNLIKTYRMQHTAVKRILEELLKEGYLRKQNRMYVLNR